MSKSVKEIAKEIRAELKKQYPKCKFSVTCRHGNEINVALMEAPVSPFGRLVTVSGDGDNIVEYPFDGDYAQLNGQHVKFDRFLEEWRSNGHILTEEGAELVKNVYEVLNKENWDESDYWRDYVNVNYFSRVDVGKWDKAFKVVAK